MNGDESTWDSQTGLAKFPAAHANRRTGPDLLSLFTEMLAALLCLTGLTAGIGWLLFIELLQNPFRTAHPMPAGGAVLFIFSGTFLWSTPLRRAALARIARAS